MSDDSDEPTDEELLDAWQERGDKQAANRLLMRHLPAIRRYFRNKLSSRPDEEDLVQQVLEGLVKAMSGFRKEASFRTFLFQVARNKLRDHFRAKTRRREDVDIDEISVADLAPGQSTILSRNRREALLIEGLRALSLADQELLEYRFWQELTVPEIAEILGLEEAAVKSRLRRANDRLRDIMAGRAESDEERAKIETGELDRWAEDVRKQNFGRRRAGSGGETGEEDGETGEDRGENDEP